MINKEKLINFIDKKMFESKISVLNMKESIAKSSYYESECEQEIITEESGYQVALLDILNFIGNK